MARRRAARRRVALRAIGCKVNQAEVGETADALQALGWAVVPFTEAADAYLVHTCTVTSTAAQKCRQALRGAVRRNPGALVVASGCYVQVSPGELLAIDGVGLVVGTDRTSELAAIIDARLPAPGPQRPPSRDTARSTFLGHTRAFLRVQSGCDRFCTYCIVPHARGGVRSRPLAEIVDGAARLVAGGHREIVLTGTNLGAWGEDLGGEGCLVDVIRAVLDVVGDGVRIRLSSIEVGDLTEAFLDLFASEDRLCPHLHLPLQSGGSDVLRRMGRPYTARGFLDRVRIVLAARPGCTFGLDAMVGFPAETDGAFEATCDVVRRIPVVRVHAFRFSPRPGTPAAGFPDRVPGGIARARSEALRELAADRSEALRRGLVGGVRTVLVESRTDERGRNCGFTEDSLDTALAGAENLVGRLVRVRITGVEGPATHGELLEQGG